MNAQWYIFLVLCIVIIGLVVALRVLGPLAKQWIGGHEKDLKKAPRSRSEADVIRYLEGKTGKKFPTVNPDWLVWKGNTLELDGYNEELNLAIEFSGPLHTKWTPQKEPYPVYFERVVRDTVKRRLCKKHKVRLIVVDFALPSRWWNVYIASRLFDFGLLTDRPADYLAVKKAVPFRNKQLEVELGLAPDMKAAKAL